MTHSIYLQLRRPSPTELPPELLKHRKGVLFARWLVLTGKISDFGPEPRDGGPDLSGTASDPGQAPAKTA
jgi:hypothetical protein